VGRGSAARFARGLVVDVASPDVETRRAIVLRKVEQLGARLHEGVRRQATFVEADRALEPELRALLEVIRGRKLL
jgi:chromosomal replication initiation ATPase DnaA